MLEHVALGDDFVEATEEFFSRHDSVLEEDWWSVSAVRSEGGKDSRFRNFAPMDMDTHLPSELGLPWHDDDVDVAAPNRVILFNDEEHTFEEVIGQIIRATGCSMTEAEAITFEVHHLGKALVFEGELGDCLKVSSVLEEIALHTQIEF